MLAFTFSLKFGTYYLWFYNLQVASFELRAANRDFKKITLRVTSSFLRVEK